MSNLLKFDNPLLHKDVYKASHKKMNPHGVTRIYSTWTARGSRLSGIDYSIFFGLVNYLDYLERKWKPFFNFPDPYIGDYSRRLKGILGYDVDIDHLIALGKYGRLPITLRAVPEGTKVALRTPSFVMESSHPEFAWVPQALETDFSNFLWKPINSATISVNRRKLDRRALEISGGPLGALDYLNHDFSYRGMSGLDDAIISGMGHLVGANGTDTIPAAARIDELYSHSGQIGTSIAASEHSVMCLTGEGLELEAFRRILREFPEVPVSIVSDTWNLWRVLENYLPALGEELTSRKAPLVIRPDSGDPIKILTGNSDGSCTSERLGVVPYLLSRYGGPITPKGYRLFPSFIGTVYGDSMNDERCSKLNEELLSLGICPSTVVRGRGSYTYEFQTRDSLGQALKATNATIDGSSVDLYKKPITDSGEKFSARGRVGLVWNESNTEVIGHREGITLGDDDGFWWTPVVDGIFESEKYSFDLVRNNTREW